uniref:Uncharacterized protein n=1 Tax=Spongospora subterranea TaxID=70186 RepID=A0A0H5QRW1_9EUKA|eukprot:CRZ04763.1 hypothetical protein [Spongospora subterranea]
MRFSHRPVPSQCPIASGEVILLHELADMELGRAVRVVGRVIDFIPGEKKAIIEMDGCHVVIITDIMVIDGSFGDHSLFTFIGEVCSYQPDPGTKCLRPRIALKVDGLNLQLYKIAIQERRKFYPIRPLDLRPK